MTKLKGGSLMYVLMIMMIISGLLGAYLWTNYYHRIYLDQRQAKHLARLNLYSGLERYLAGYDSHPDEVSWNLFLEGAGPSEANRRDSVFISREAWGFFDLLHIKGKHQKKTSEANVLVGQGLAPERQYSLWLKDLGSSLALVGRSHLKGKLFLPFAGLTAGRIGHQGFEGEVLHRGEVFASKQHSQSWVPVHAVEVQQLLEEVRQSEPDEQLRLYDLASWHSPWDSTATEVLSQGDLILADCELRGKIIVLCAGRLLVKASAHLEQVMLLAREIKFEAQFEGRVQALATQSIELGEGVRLNYPSLLFVEPDLQKPAKIKLAPDSQLEGSLLSYRAGASVNEDHTLIEQGATVWGIVLVDQGLDLRGAVHGSVTTKNFLLRHGPTPYRNYLLGGSIDFDRLARGYVGPRLWPEGPAEIVEWL